MAYQKKEFAKNAKRSIVLHVWTQKGKGFKPAEDNPDKFHGVGKFNKITGEIMSSGKDDYSKVFGRKLVSLASKNKKIVAITAAMMDGTGLSSFATKYPDRFFDVGIAEGHALTFAAGLARSGMIPFVSIYSSFYQRGYDQVIHDICMQNLPVVMCVDRAGIVGNDGETHQGMFDMAFFKIVPNITIMAPRNFIELENMMEFALELKRPVVIRYPRGGVEEDNYKVKKLKLGKSELLEEGNDLSIITIGKGVEKAIKLNKLLKENNITCDLINCRFLKPFDSKIVIDSINKTGRVVVIEDGTITSGLCSTIKEIISDNKLDVISKYYAYPDKYIEHGSVSELEKKYKQNIEFIYNDILKIINK